MHLGMINQRKIDRLSHHIKRPNVINAGEGWHVILPNAPSPFFGRNHLVSYVAGLLLNRQHVTLCGPGGIGKTSLAKAIIHDPFIAERFRGRRFFVSFDGSDPSKLSMRTLKEQICRGVGLDLVSANGGKK